MNFGIIGCGLIGVKRARSIFESGHKITIMCDVDSNKSRALADQFKCDCITNTYKDVIHKEDVDIIVVATSNNLLAKITLEAVKNDKNVIVEKPGAISSHELEPIISELEKRKVVVKVGFNHRYHPAMLQAMEIIKNEDVGEIMFIRGRYGHGGRVGYDREWRADKSISGGGETIDQGVHLLDLSRWFMGDFDKVEGFAATYYWDMEVDDNGFICLRKEDNRCAWLQVSCTEWKNMFSFEIYCKHAKLMIEGLGGSYGVERLYYYKMLPEMGPPITKIYEYSRGDDSWKMELKDVVEAVESGSELFMGDIHDAYESLKIVEQIYGGSDVKG